MSKETLELICGALSLSKWAAINANRPDLADRLGWLIKETIQVYDELYDLDS